jgi:hypothetical protein
MVQGVILYVHTSAGGVVLCLVVSRPVSSGRPTTKRRIHALSSALFLVCPRISCPAPTCVWQMYNLSQTKRSNSESSSPLGCGSARTLRLSIALAWRWQKANMCPK